LAPRRPTHSRGASRGHNHKAAHAKPAKKPGPGHRRGGSQRPRDYAAYEREPATPEYMARLFADHDFARQTQELDRFWQYYLLLRQHNAHLDLTRIMGIEATVLKHFIDSALPARMLDLSGPLLDIGSGPGFPGVPIAILQPETRVILAESRGKRADFLRLLVRELALPHVSVHDRSVREDSPFVPAGAPDPSPPGTLAVQDVVTRALEDIPATLVRVQAFLPPGGRAIFFKGPNCGQEVTDAQQRLKGVYRMSGDIRYTLPRTSQQRRLVVFERRGTGFEALG